MSEESNDGRDKIMTVEEVADYIHFAAGFVRKVLKSGAMKGVKPGKKWLVRRSWVDEWFDAHLDR